MAPANPLANWEKVDDSFYRKIPVYDAVFDEDTELENYIVVGAPYGGAIGMHWHQDTRKAIAHLSHSIVSRREQAVSA